MDDITYLGVSQKDLESIFLDVGKVFSYANSITPISLTGDPFKRVGAHIIFVPIQVFEKAVEEGKYTQELKAKYDQIVTHQKVIRGETHVRLIDNKTDQTREVLDYIISQGKETIIYVLSPDNMFWFFHDIGHGYLAEICDNFYENVYGFPEMLVNLFACIKQKQYKVYSRKVIDVEIGERCVRYKQEDKEYFFKLLDSLQLEDDI